MKRPKQLKKNDREINNIINARITIINVIWIMSPQPAEILQSRSLTVIECPSKIGYCRSKGMR